MLCDTEGQYRGVISHVQLEANKDRAFKYLPADVRAEFQALYGQGWEAIFSEPASTPVQQAKALHAKWLAEVEQRISALRVAKAGKGRELTQRQAGISR